MISHRGLFLAASLIMIGSLCFVFISYSKAFSNENEIVCKIGSKNYSTFQSALNEALPGDTIQLMVDKLTVQRYGSQNYGKWTEITADKYNDPKIGMPMEASDMANVVLRRDPDSDGYCQVINSYDSSHTPPKGFITIRGLEDVGTQVGSIDLSGADKIRLENLNFDAIDEVRSFKYYCGSNDTSSDSYPISISKDGIHDCKISTWCTGSDPSITDVFANIVDVSMNGIGDDDEFARITPNRNSAISVEVNNCNFFGDSIHGYDGHCIAVNCVGARSQHCGDWKIHKCNFNRSEGMNLYLQYFNNQNTPNNTLTIDHNKFGNENTSTYGACSYSGTQTWGDITISNNEFWNFCANTEGEPGYAIKLNPAYACYYTIKNNICKFSDPLDFIHNGLCGITKPRNDIVINDINYDDSNPEKLDAFSKALEDYNTNCGHGVKDNYDGKIHYDWYFTEVPLLSHTVTFHPENGEEATSVQVYDGEKVSKPLDPTWDDDHLFLFWTLNLEDGNSEPFDFNTEIHSNLDLYASWTVAEVKVDVDVPEEIVIDEQSKAICGSMATEISLFLADDTPSLPEGIVLDGSLEEQKEAFQDLVEVVNIYKEDMENRELHVTMCPHAEDKDKQVPVHEISKFKNVCLPNVDFDTTIGLACVYNFGVDYTVKVTGDITKEKTVALSEVNEPIKYEIDNLANKDSMWDGAIQVLRFHDNEAADISDLSITDRVNQKIYVMADKFSTYLVDYSPDLFVYFNHNYEGGPIDKVSYPYNSLITQIPVPVRANYNFNNWYIDSDCTELFDFSQPLVAQTNVYALWNEIPAPTPDNPEYYDSNVLTADDCTLFIFIFVSLFYLAFYIKISSKNR